MRMSWKKALVIAVVVLIVVAIAGWAVVRNSGKATLALEDQMGVSPEILAPDPPIVTTLNFATVVGWKDGETPTPAAGLKVNAFAVDLDHPRWIVPLANGDVLVSETTGPRRPPAKSLRGIVRGFVMRRAGAAGDNANRVVLLRDADGDGVAESRTVLLSGLDSPVGMAVANGQLYVAETSKLTRFPFTVGQTTITAPGVKVVDLPSRPLNHHWVKNVIASPDGAKLYVTIGSNSNIGENGMAVEEGRAAIWEVDAATGQHRIFATGLRNPNGMAWNPVTGELWTVVNERDGLGSDIVPDYLASVGLGDSFGWPCFYWGGYVDKRVADCDVQQAQYIRRPEYALGTHTAALGLNFATGQMLGARFAEGAFIGQHGSWNRKPKAGYQVIFVPFVNGKPTGKPLPVLTGFLNTKGEARGRPVEVAIDRTGSLLVADDAGNRIWRVSAQ
ncbi:MAG TPA: sorbosone dehydrogenase family protein [Sphingomonadaceae bacterium]|nr:sorbosone dehydrogenase family protein [Sphingomonadaceae bacterium]